MSTEAVTTEQPTARPGCYGRADFPGGWRPGCSAWFPGGNAERLARNPSSGEDWAACEGCRQKAAAIEFKGKVAP